MMEGTKSLIMEGTKLLIMEGTPPLWGVPYPTL